MPLKKKYRLDIALDNLYKTMIAGDISRKKEGKPLLWGEDGWWSESKCDWCGQTVRLPKELCSDCCGNG